MLEKDGFKRDSEYWNCYYKKNVKEIQGPSDFAKYILAYLKPGKTLVDLGCGNGRDSVFFAKHGIEVTGIDAAEEAINILTRRQVENADFLCDDFVTSDILKQSKYDYFYSRWTMHAISEEQEEKLLYNIENALKEEGIFFVEARSIKDELCGKGEKVSENAYIYNNHFRRFMDRKHFQDKLERFGFEIISSEEGKNFSKTIESDPVLVRIIAKKMFVRKALVNENDFK